MGVMMAADVEPTTETLQTRFSPAGPDGEDVLIDIVTTKTPQVPEAPEASERGRYAVFETPDGGWKIATAGPLCENCSGCGCGSAYRDPIAVPAFVVQMVTGGGISGVPAPLRAMLGKVMGNGRS